MSFLAAPPAPKYRVDPAAMKIAQQLRHPSPLLAGRCDPTGEYAFVAAQDNNVVRWHLGTSKATVLAGHTSWVRSLAFAGRTLFTGDYAGRLVAWDAHAATPKPVREIDAHRGWLRALATSRDGKTLATCGNDGLVKLWSAADLKPVATLEGHDCHVYNVAFHPGGKLLASADLKGNVHEWDLATGKIARTLDAKILHKYDPSFKADIGGVRAMAYDATGAHLACAGITNVSNAFAGVGNPLVVLLDTATGKQKSQLKPKAAFQGTAWGVAFHPAGFVVAVGGGNGGEVWAWKGADTASTHTLKLPTNARDMDVHPDGRRIVVPCQDGVTRVVDMGVIDGV